VLAKRFRATARPKPGRASGISEDSTLEGVNTPPWPGATSAAVKR